jgi:hypothetical protein
MLISCYISVCLWMVQYLREYQTFIGTARYWTETFAKASSLGVEEKVCFSLSVVVSLSLSLPPSLPLG